MAAGGGGGGGDAARVAGVHDSAARGFTAATIGAYEKGRPDWSAAQVRHVLDGAGAQSWRTADDGSFPAGGVLEVGAGTGKFTRPLLAELAARCERGGTPRLVVVEPTTMAAELASELEARHVRLLATTADRLHEVATGSKDCVVAAQAFHWFADAGSIDELHRVLRPGGVLALAWNIRDRDGGDVAAEVEALIDSYYDAATPRQHSHAWRAPLAAHGGFGDVVYEKAPRDGGPHITSAADFATWMTSLSIIAKLPDAEKAAVRDRVAALITARAHPVAAAADGTPLYAVPMYTDYYWAVKRA